MEKFTDFNGLAVSFVKNNIDTDAIIPKQFLTSVKKTGYGLFLFNDYRWLKPAADSSVTINDLEPNPDFVLNQERYKDAEILVAGSNFGCGSSREHAVWALQGYGFKTIIAASFADIFSGNSNQNGLLLIKQSIEVIKQIEQDCLAEKGYKINVVLSDDKPYIEASGKRHHFDVDPRAKEFLLAGLDEIGVTERMFDKIKDYEKKRNELEPWLDISSHR